MTTRGSLARGQGQQQFQGNVQKWVREWVEPGSGPGSSKVALLKWVPTGDRSGSKPGPRFPHLHPVSNTNLKVPAGNKDKGKKPVARHHEPLLSQPAAMDLDGDQPVRASKLQQEQTQSVAVDAGRPRDTYGEANTASEHQEPPAASRQHVTGALSEQREVEAAPEASRSLPDVATEQLKTSNSHAHTPPQRTPAPAADLLSHRPLPASQSQQDNMQGSKEELQDAPAAEKGSTGFLPASLGDEAPGQAPAGGDDEMLTGQQAPSQAPDGRDDEMLTGQETTDQAMAAEKLDVTLAGDKARSWASDEALNVPGLPSAASDQAPGSRARETAVSDATLDGATKVQQPAEEPPSESHSLSEQPLIHSEPAAAAPTPHKRPAEGVSEGMELDAKRARTVTGQEYSS